MKPVGFNRPLYRLVMTVNPGFRDQHSLHTAAPKIRRVRQMVEESRPACDLEVDRGIDPATARVAVEAGANFLGAGTFTAGIKALRASLHFVEQQTSTRSRICSLE